MLAKPVVCAMVPARLGSTRLKMKNLALIDGEPMVGYAINSAINSNVFDNVYLNSENDIFKSISDDYGAKFYKRKYKLGSSITKSDEVIADFISSHPEYDIVVWVNSISPFQTPEEIRNIVNYFIDNKLDSLITVSNHNVHCMYDNNPLNFNMSEVFAQTQDLIPVQSFVYSVMMWRSKSFMQDYKNKGYGIFCGNFGTYPVGKLTEIIIKDQNDLMLADLLMRSIRKNQDKYEIKYDKSVETIK
jgi:CMP-N-acetylneuraminic acid synthetase